MAFNLDDPLADILSEGDSDSFFDIGSKPKTQPQKQSTPKSTTPATSTKFESLFGIKETSIPKETLKPPEPKIAKNAEIAKTTPAPIPKPSTSFNDDDLISDLGFDPKKPKTINPGNILDDILGSMETKKPNISAVTRPQTTGSIVKEDSKVVSRQSTDTTESTVAGASVPSISRPKTAIGPRASVASSNDPLGLLGVSAKDTTTTTKEIRETPKMGRRKATPADWLGLEPESKPEKEQPVPVETEKSHPPQIFQVHDYQQPLQTVSQSITQSFDPAANTLLFTTSAIESQNTLQALQQQEAQLVLAAQMKNQETALLEMQQRQQQLLAQQEAQFNNLVQKQLTRQSQLETAIRAQQERINSHIQMLMSRPAVIPSLSGSTGEKTVEERLKQSEDHLEEVELRAEVKRLELEKLRLEDLISNVNANHEKEIEFMEMSHKKQIEVLDGNYQSSQNRLKDEIQNLENYYGKKLDTLELEKQHLIEVYETKLKNVIEERDTVVKELKENYKAEIDSMRQEHKAMVENIRQSKLMEFAVIQDNTSYLQTLKSASTHLQDVSGDLQTLRDELNSRIDTAHREREAKLDARERLVEDKERQLKIIEETAEQERNRLIDLVATLESQLSKLTKETSNEQWTIRQKLSTLEVERSAFEREKQFAKEQLSREEKHIEELKQQHLDEHQRMMQQIQDEKQHISVERARLETAKKLHSNSNTEQMKSEAEAALKVAQDAARQADQERERYLNLQRQLETQKRDLVDEASGLRQKQDELEALVQSAKAKNRHVQEALLRARQAEQNFIEKLQALQAQMRQTMQHEAQLSADRVELSRQRFELQEVKKRLEDTKCSLCRIGEKSTEISRILSRDNREGIPSQVVAPVNIGYGLVGYSQSSVDHLFDDDLAQCLRRMQVKDFGAGVLSNIDPTLADHLPQRSRNERTYNVPTQTIESDLLQATMDAQEVTRE